MENEEEFIYYGEEGKSVYPLLEQNKVIVLTFLVFSCGCPKLVV